MRTETEVRELIAQYEAEINQFKDELSKPAINNVEGYKDYVHDLIVGLREKKRILLWVIGYENESNMVGL